MAQLVVRLSVSQCVVSLSPRGAEHFGMPSLVYATGHIKDPVPLIEKRRRKEKRDCLPVVGFLLVSFIK